MTSFSDAVDHASRRLVIVLPGGYDEARARYEHEVPEIDYGPLATTSSWDDVLTEVARQATHGFLRYFTGDVGAVMTGSPSRWRATQYLMGNHTIAETMFRHDPSAVLHAPLRVLLYADAAGATRMAVDQPSLLFASYGLTEITEVGKHLDVLLSELVGVLGGELPASFA